MNTEFSSIFYEFKSDIDCYNAFHVDRERCRGDHNHPMGKKQKGGKDDTIQKSTLSNGGKAFGLSNKDAYTAANKKLADDYNNGNAKQIKAFDNYVKTRRDKIKSSNECGLMDYDLI